MSVEHLKDAPPIDWRLITDLPVTTPDEAIEKLDWYASVEADATVLDDVALDEIRRFAQARGKILMNGVEIGSIQTAEFTFSNNLEKDESIREDSRISGADPQMAQVTGKITAKYDSVELIQQAESRKPVALQFGWTLDGWTYTVELPRVFLPKSKKPISGPRGIQIDYQFSTSGAAGNCMIATLINDQAAGDYA